MLIRSRSRGPIGPECDFLCSNVFYMPHALPHNLPQTLPLPKRPNSATPKRPNSATERGILRPKKPLCAIKTPKRVIQGSSFDAKQTSKFHERCMPEWVPSPGLCF